MGGMVKNWWTTIVGIVGAVGIYVGGIGTKMPESKGEWMTFWVGLVMAALGVVSKDATTGSQPK